MIMEKHIPSWKAHLHLALTVLTRLPVPSIVVEDSDAVARSMSMFPLVGALVGLLGGLVYAGTTHFLPTLAAALMALTATIVLTGALHEDGLADLADGLGARGDVATRLSVMRDPHVGAFGTVALILSVGLRASLLSSAPGGWSGMLALAAAAALSRAAIPAVMQTLPPARSDGLGAGAGVPDFSTAATAAFLALVLALVCMGFAAGIAATVGTVAGAAAIAWISRRTLGGYTGDVLGAVQQLAEIGALMGIASQW